MSGPDPLDLMEPAELAQEASRHLLAALALLDDVSRTLRGESPPPRVASCNVLLFSARSRKKRRGRHAVA
jgi:hypothetical protein